MAKSEQYCILLSQVLTKELTMRSEVFVVLKEVIKSKGLSYKMISEKLSMSESGFKKLMSTKDCSISKLDQICEVLNISFDDLIELSRKKDNNLVLNKQQEDLFFKNPSYYHFLLELIEAEYDWKKLKEEFRLTKKKCLEVLLALDKVGLITLLPGNKVKKTFKGCDISITARLGEKVSWDIDEAFFHHARKKFKEAKSTAMGTRGNYRLKKESLNELIDSIRDITKEFSKRSKREMILYKEKELCDVTMLSFVAQDFRINDHMKI